MSGDWFGCVLASPSQNYTQPNDHTSSAYDTTPEFKPFTVLYCNTGKRAIY